MLIGWILLTLFLAIFTAPADAQIGCVPNPNATLDRINNLFIDGCPLPPSSLNRAFGHVSAASAMFDPRSYGATCGGGDATVAIQNAVTAAETSGGEVVIPCPLTVAGTVTVSTGGIRIHGIGPGNSYPGQQDTPGPSIWPPTKGPAINCTGTAGSGCIVINGAQGVEIDHFVAGNPQPLPPPCPPTGPCNSWTPTVYPFVIATVQGSGWQGLNIHDVTCTACSKFIDLEGTADYHLFTATEIILRDLWCNVCLETGVRFHLIDNPLLVDHVDFVGQWNGNLPSLGYYQRTHLVAFDMQYLAAPQFANINFWVAKTAMQVTNGTVTNNALPGQPTITMAMSAGQFTNVMFNNPCQAVTMPNGNGTIAEFYFSNTYVWGDQSGFACSAGKAMFDMPSNFVRLFMFQVGVAIADTFVNIGCGTPGTGGCPAGVAGGGSIARFVGIRADSYSAYTAGQPFIKVPSNVALLLAGSDPPEIVPASGGGNLLGPGLDGSQGYSSGLAVGGGRLARRPTSAEIPAANATEPPASSGLRTARSRHRPDPSSAPYRRSR